MTNPIYDKTEKGREEIATRKHLLASRLRSLLVLVDGKTGVDGLLKKVSGLGLTDRSVAELLALGLIAPSINPVQQQANATAAILSTADSGALVKSEDDAATPTAANPATILSEGESQFQALYNFYTATIKSTIGLRGYALQLKVERSTSIDDFKALRQSYYDAVLKSKGPEMARGLGERLDHLLSLS